MKYLFIIQGEGRGHFTQALSLKNLLEENGHEVTGFLVGKSAKRRLPDFFTNKIAPEKLIKFRSPNFLPMPKGKNSPLLVSFLFNTLLIPSYLNSMLNIRRHILRTKPDVVINFYELICGLTYGFFNLKTPMVNIAHQYYFLTPSFKYTGNKTQAFKFLKLFTRVTALNSTKILALSFRPEKIQSDSIIKVVPPLLRKNVLLSRPTEGDYIHGYMLNSGYATALANWSKNHPEQELHFFWDKKNVEATTHLTPHLTLHRLCDAMFLEYMKGSKAYATTGGFESVCEAMYFQKPILMVPTHIEQECNVIDALNSGAGVTCESFDLNQLVEHIPHYKKSSKFYHWVQLADSKFMCELTNVKYDVSLHETSFQIFLGFLKFNY